MMAKVSLRILYLLGFILALSEAFPAYIRSSFIEEFVAVQWVGVFFIGVAILSLILINFFPLLIKKFSNYRLMVAVLVLNILSTSLLITASSTVLAFIAFIVLGSTSSLIWINMDIFIERLTSNITTGKTRTTYFTILNLAWVLTPLTVGWLVGENNYRLIYYVSILLVLVVLVLMLVKRRQLADHIVYKHHHTWQTLKNIWRNSNLRNIFSIAFLLELFFIFAVVYIPIYLHENIGLSWLVIGGIFTFMLLPFIVLQIPAGTMADRYHNEKKIFTFGFMIMIAALLLIFFTESANPVVWALILFMSRCGAALIQAMRESYFFKIVDVKDIDYINFFRDIRPLAILIGTGLGVLLLGIFPMKYLFLFVAVVLISGFYFTWRLRTVRPRE